VIGLSGEKFYFESGSDGRLALDVDGFGDDNLVFVEGQVRDGKWVVVDGFGIVFGHKSPKIQGIRQVQALGWT